MRPKGAVDEQLWSRMAAEAVISSKLFSARRVASLYLELARADQVGSVPYSDVANTSPVTESLRPTL